MGVLNNIELQTSKGQAPDVTVTISTAAMEIPARAYAGSRSRAVRVAAWAIIHQQLHLAVDPKGRAALW